MMTCPPGCFASSGWSEFIAAFSAIVSWVLIIVGWLVVSHGHNKRERRKEIRNQIEDLVRVVRDIETAAHGYLPTKADSNEGRALALRIKSELQRLGLALERLIAREKLELKTELLTAFRRCVTGGDFECSGRHPCNLDSARALEVSIEANVLIDALESAFRNKFE